MPTRWRSTPRSPTRRWPRSWPNTTSARLVAFRGIAEGVENSNYSLRTTPGDFILTLYEKRVDPAELPWFLGPDGASGRPGHRLPAAGARAGRRALRQLCGRPRGDHHLPARRLAPPGAAGALRPARRGARRRCTWRATATRRRGATRSGPRGLAAAARPLPRRARTRCSRAWPASWTRRWRAILAALARRPAGRAHPRRSVPRQRVLPRGPRIRPDRLLFRRHGSCWPTTSRSASTPGASSRIIRST